MTNACKYGKANGEVVARLRLTESPFFAGASKSFLGASSRLELQVRNAPGPRHALLVKLDPRLAAEAVFSPGETTLEIIST